jgi:hypothetical protein
MHKILEKIADWLVEKEEKEAEKCDIPDEVVNEWLYSGGSSRVFKIEFAA